MTDEEAGLIVAEECASWPLELLAEAPDELPKPDTADAGEAGKVPEDARAVVDGRGEADARLLCRDDAE
jgi:hypothetical protein